MGHLAAWNYFMSAESDVNDAFIEDWLKFINTRVNLDLASFSDDIWSH